MFQTKKKVAPPKKPAPVEKKTKKPAASGTGAKDMMDEIDDVLAQADAMAAEEQEAAEQAAREEEERAARRAEWSKPKRVDVCTCW